SISLGADYSVCVTYNPQSEKINNPTGGFMTTSRVSTIYQQGISIKNIHNLGLSGLVVKDQVPISRHAQINVHTHESPPSDLQPGASKNGTEAQSSAASKLSFRGTRMSELAGIALTRTKMRSLLEEL